MATQFTVSLRGIYPQDSTDPAVVLKATGFTLTVNNGPIKTSVDLGFDEGLELLRQVTERSAQYRNAVQHQLEVTAKLAAAESAVNALEQGEVERWSMEHGA